MTDTIGSVQADKIFNIKVGEFQGSLEALLDMVQKRKLSISDISLARVADDYIAYVRKLGNSPSIEIANFIVIAATLLLIKSKSLLPTLDLTEDEEESIKDLEEQLQLYSIYKQASDAIAEHLKVCKQLVAPKQGLGANSTLAQIVFAPTPGLNLAALKYVMGDVLAQLPVVSKKPKVAISETIKIDDVMNNLLKRVQNSANTSFANITGEDRVNTLVSFLALLELIKDGVLLAEQSSAYGEILLVKQGAVI